MYLWRCSLSRATNSDWAALPAFCLHLRQTNYMQSRWDVWFPSRRNAVTLVKRHEMKHLRQSWACFKPAFFQRQALSLSDVLNEISAPVAGPIKVSETGIKSHFFKNLNYARRWAHNECYYAQQSFTWLLFPQLILSLRWFMESIILRCNWVHIHLRVYSFKRRQTHFFYSRNVWIKGRD